ncbi:hypothetical protein [Ilumatobacter sp.]|uniref:hypothetical protein n=1 Tax=Ilumatobacter sp. TaxID=1967498 RepID=UPI003B52119A
MSSKSPLQTAGMRLAGLKRTGSREQIREAEHVLATLWLERYIEEAIAVDLNRASRRRLAKYLMSGEPT